MSYYCQIQIETFLSKDDRELCEARHEIVQWLISCGDTYNAGCIASLPDLIGYQSEQIRIALRQIILITELDDAHLAQTLILRERDGILKTQTKLQSR